MNYLLPAMLLLIFALCFKVHMLRKSADEIGRAFRERLDTETNTLIDISGRDRHMRALAMTINSELRKLREQRREYRRGDRELKNAVSGISHDLRTPLTAISGYAGLLEGEKDPEKAAEYIRIIKNRAEALSKLSEELFRYSLEAAQDSPLKLCPLSLNAALEESLAAFYTELSGKGIVPEIELPEEPVIRSLDRVALSRVFGNVIGNAVKYSAGDLRVSLSPEGCIEFKNQAPGLDSVQTARLFERFYTLESARRSTGLGLSIARLLTERMGGTIRASYQDSSLSIMILFEKETK